MSKSNTVPIIRRRVNIPFDPAKAVGWYSPQEFEDCMNALSFMFPSGERFFVQSVQPYYERITDPVLKEEVRQFIYQESMHSKEHARCNSAITFSVPEAHRIERLFEVLIAGLRLITPPVTRLAITSALEHFTAVLADHILRHQHTYFTNSDPNFAALWLWHSVEEAEHKAVCFDVYEYFYGKGTLAYLHRVAAMSFVTTISVVIMWAATSYLRRAYRKRRLATGMSYSAPGGRRLGFWRVALEHISLKHYFDYYRRSFHPWDYDNTAYIEEWKQRYKDFTGAPEPGASEVRA